MAMRFRSGGATAVGAGLLLLIAGCADAAMPVVSAQQSNVSGSSGTSYVGSPPASTSVSTGTDSAGSAGAAGATALARSGTARPGSNAVAPPLSTVPRSSPSASVASALTINLTAADSGRTITVATGSVVNIDLAPDTGSYDPPSVDHPAVLRETAHHGGYPATSDAVATFAAIADGSATITSLTDLACLHTTPRCLPPQREFRVTLVVD
jgi:hypothetical protein